MPGSSEGFGFAITSAIVAFLSRCNRGRSCKVFTFQRSWQQVVAVQAWAFGPTVSTPLPSRSAMPAAATDTRLTLFVDSQVASLNAYFQRAEA